MDFAVLVKVVPGLDELRFDPDRRTVVREGAELFLNPFDQRALQVALRLRLPGEKVTVLSLGPPHAVAPLKDAVALGADRVLLLSDPRFAGSDTLATARALVAGLGRVGHEVVLGGAWTTDSETGQVGPEVAALLGVPVLTGARGMARNATGSDFLVTVDTAAGWATFHAPAPLLVTVGEKITKPGKVLPEDRARVPDAAVEMLSLDDLALAAGSVGLAGSPTVVRSVAEDAPHRVPVLISEGTPEERVARAVDALRPLLMRPVASPAPWPSPPSSRSPDREVLVLVTDAAGAIAPGVLAVLAELRRSLPNCGPSAVWAGCAPSSAETARLETAGALAGYHVPVARLPTGSRTAAVAFGIALRHRPRAAAGAIVSDLFGREVAGQVAAVRSLGLTGDAIAVREEADGTLVWSKPSFGGRTIAAISSRTRPSLATVRPGAGGEGGGTAESAFAWETLATAPDGERSTPIEHGTELVPGTPSLGDHDVIVAVGMGVGGPDGVAALAPVLERWNAALGATRRVVDAGWVPRQHQIGLTGRALSPRLGVLLGVSGSTNHLVGWKRAHALLAVNRDPAAPVFRDVDVGIVGTVEEIAPLLAEALAPLLRR